MHWSCHGKDIFQYNPFLCKRPRVRKCVLAFDGHFVYDQVSDLKHLNFYLFIRTYSAKLKADFVICFSFLRGTNFSNTLYDFPFYQHLLGPKRSIECLHVCQ